MGRQLHANISIQQGAHVSKYFQERQKIACLWFILLFCWYTQWERTEYSFDARLPLSARNRLSNGWWALVQRTQSYGIVVGVSFFWNFQFKKNNNNKIFRKFSNNLLFISFYWLKISLNLQPIIFSSNILKYE